MCEWFKVNIHKTMRCYNPMTGTFRNSGEDFFVYPIFNGKSQKVFSSSPHYLRMHFLSTKDIFKSM